MFINDPNFNFIVICMGIAFAIAFGIEWLAKRKFDNESE